MTEIPFDSHTLILEFPCVIEYTSSAVVNLCFDTGASTVIIRNKVLESIGFDLTAVREKATFGDASTSHIVPVITLKSLTLGGERIEDIQALAYTIPEEHGIDGVIGLNFLRHSKITLDFEQGILLLDRITST